MEKGLLKEGFDVASITASDTINIALDTIKNRKQALIFANTKQGAEKLAEDIAKNINVKNPAYTELAKKTLHALSSPTKQCKRLSQSLEKGIAFHHSGLASKQRELIEDSFRSGIIKIICCTPTLAAGLDLPAYRVIIRDLKRFTQQGMSWIPVLEYLQQSGRAGRPSFDVEGESIIVAKDEKEKEVLIQKYIFGEPEEIFSKLAVAPVLRTYLLSLISINHVNSRQEIFEFFEKTFWAHQFQDAERLEKIINEMIHLLIQWGFVEEINGCNDAKKNKEEYNKPKQQNALAQSQDFVSADSIMNKEKYDRLSAKKNVNLVSAGSENLNFLRIQLVATPIGKRVSELYLDPLTANYFIGCLKKAFEKKQDKINVEQMLHMTCRTLEMRPLLSMRTKDYIPVEEFYEIHRLEFLEEVPTPWDSDYEEFLSAIKTSMFILDWISEHDEDYLLETYNIRPGEIRAKLDNADWLLYSIFEMMRILKYQRYQSQVSKLRLRIKHGVSNELLSLVRIRNIGRVRARKLFSNGIKDVQDIKNTSITTLVQILGRDVASKVKSAVDGNVSSIPVQENKRKGQISLKDF